MPNSQITYREFVILIDRQDAQPYSVCFDKFEADYGDYDTLAQAKKAINRFWQEVGE